MTNDVVGTLFSRAENYVRLHGHKDPVFAEAIAEITKLREELDHTSDQLNDALREPWPAWASSIYEKLKKYGCDFDPYEGVNLADEFDLWVDDYSAECQRDASRLAALLPPILSYAESFLSVLQPGQHPLPRPSAASPHEVSEAISAVRKLLDELESKE